MWGVSSSPAGDTSLPVIAPPGLSATSCTGPWAGAPQSGGSSSPSPRFPHCAKLKHAGPEAECAQPEAGHPHSVPPTAELVAPLPAPLVVGSQACANTPRFQTLSTQNLCALEGPGLEVGRGRTQSKHIHGKDGTNEKTHVAQSALPWPREQGLPAALQGPRRTDGRTDRRTDSLLHQGGQPGYCL